MSYSIKVVKDDEGLRLEQPSEGGLQHIPNGTFTITGHYVTGEPGRSTAETIGVRHEDSDGNSRASVSATANRGGTPGGAQ